MHLFVNRFIRSTTNSYSSEITILKITTIQPSPTYNIIILVPVLQVSSEHIYGQMDKKVNQNVRRYNIKAFSACLHANSKRFRNAFQCQKGPLKKTNSAIMFVLAFTNLPVISHDAIPALQHHLDRVKQI